MTQNALVRRMHIKINTARNRSTQFVHLINPVTVFFRVDSKAVYVVAFLPFLRNVSAYRTKISTSLTMKISLLDIFKPANSEKISPKLLLIILMKDSTLKNK